MSNLTVKKIIESQFSDPSHVNLSFPADLLFTKKIAYVASGDGAGQIEYIGYSLPGTTESQPRWLIKKLTYDSSHRQTDEQFAGGASNFDQIWSNRASLSYS